MTTLSPPSVVAPATQTADPARTRAVILLVACGATFLSLLDSTVVNLAIPALHTSFAGANVSDLSWVITLYMIVFAALLSPAGRLADVLGRRQMFTGGVALFTGASLFAAAAPTFGLLLAARALQGAGAAAMIPTSLALILANTPPERRGAAIGIWSASASAAAAVGPAVGGVLVDAFGWRALFVLNVPIGIAMLVGTRSIPRGERAPGRTPDLLGTALLGAGLGLVVLGITQGSAWHWTDERTLAALGAGVAALAVTVARSRRHVAPALEIGLWRIHAFATANAVSFFFGVLLYAWLLNGVLFLVDQWGYSEIEAGFAVSPGAVMSAIAGFLLGRAGGRVSPRVAVAAGGVLILASGLVGGLALPAEPNFLGYWLPLGLVVGTGMGAVSVGVSSAAALGSPIRFAGATGLNVTCRQLGGALGVAALATILRSTPGLHGFEAVNLVCAVAAAIVVVLSVGLALAPAPAPSEVRS